MMDGALEISGNLSSSSLMPTFFLIGAGKAGTTSFYHYIKQHPQIYLSRVKEPLFFISTGLERQFNGPGDTEINSRMVKTLEGYQNLFRDGSDFEARGEGSTAYLYYATAAEKIYQSIPHAKLIVLLRAPADRAYSNYMHALRTGRDPLWDFEAALDAEPERIASGWSHFYHYKSKGFYYRQLCDWFHYFPREQFLILLYEDLKNDPVSILHETFKFLNVDPEQPINFADKLNASPGYRALRLYEYLKYLAYIARPFTSSRMRTYCKQKLFKSETPISDLIRKRLQLEYEPDINQLSKLIDRDLSHWHDPRI